MKIRYGFIAVLLAICMSQNGYAAETQQPRLLQNHTDEGAIHLFVKGVEDPEEVTCRYGRQVYSEIGWHSLTEAGEERETLVLVDNSLSMSRRYRDQIENVILELFEHASENERFRIAVFGETTDYLTEYTNLYTPLEDAVLKMEYYDRETYLTDTIMEVINQWELNVKPSVYRRMIIISDGQESESMLHTDEELLLKLKENAYPVYMIACIKGNQSSVSHMAVISRLSGADLYYLDQKTDPKEIALSLLEDRDVLHITMVPEKEWMNGDVVQAKLMFLKQGLISGLEVRLKMPYAPVATTEPETELKQEGEPEPETTIQPEPMPVAGTKVSEKPRHTAGWIVGGISIILGVAGIGTGGYLLLQRRKGMQENVVSRTFDTQQLHIANEEDWGRYGNRDTQLLRSDEATGSETTLLFEDDEVCEMLLTDQSNPSKFFSIPIRDSIIIGRNVRNSNVVLDYDDSVSGRHCEIEKRGSRFFVRDLQSSNGTKVNGIKVISETELFSGNLLRIGGLEMKVGWNTHG